MLDQAKHRILAAPSVMAGVDLSRPLAEILQDAADAPALRVRLAVLEQEIPVAQRVALHSFLCFFCRGGGVSLSVAPRFLFLLLGGGCLSGTLFLFLSGAVPSKNVN